MQTVPKTPITAIVVMYNEDRRLKQCLENLAFCDQIIAVDLGSTDRCVEIAKACGIELIHHPWVPISEFVLPDIVPMSRNPWIIRLDPDEVFPPALVDDVFDSIFDHDRAGMISLPHQFYFLGTPLTTTFWGNIQYVARIFHKERVDVLPHVHRGIDLKDGYTHEIITFNGKNAVQHYWVDRLSQLFEKHRRYIKFEGKSRYETGQRFTWPGMFRDVAQALLSSLIKKKGFSGGVNGIFLSFFYAGYVGMGMLSLRKYQKVKKKESHL
jgi:glycosyltransferase involved in cell wall biosynthesis